MNNLNKICALAMCEQMEYDLFNDETAMAIDMISGKPTDDEDKDDSVEALHGSDKSMDESFLSMFKEKKIIKIS